MIKMSIFLDVLVIIIIGVFVVIGFKKGLIKTVVSVIGTFLASALSVFLSNPISEYIY
ncbi:MAG: CvpA family protein, partial [Lachnospiraceae bacterium]|nr:CvpA family protein [Lachnospiraceae bacterium]